MSFHQKRIKLLLTEKEVDLLSNIFMNKQLEYQDDNEMENYRILTKIAIKLSTAKYKAKK